ncbi:MAG: histidine kinase [Muribaculaceae bacterium]|nr:histidine kinase [Muribaculaceae bacterium]
MKREIFIHIICWAVVIFFPLLFLGQNALPGETMPRFVRSLGSPIAYMVVFYLNYVVLVPRLLFGNRRWLFYVVNIAVVTLAVAFMAEWWHLMNTLLPETGRHHPPRPGINPMYFYSTITLMLVVGLSIAIRMTRRYHDAEQARIEAERDRTEAELANLRNQLNPHFLLNTLNNIYALISFDSGKAQTAVEDLSRLLRHVLYDNRQPLVPLSKEAAFMRDYVSLMRIRLTDAVTVEEHIDVDPRDMTPIAPLIFISLVENAFKHGISSTGLGRISISLKRDGARVVCTIVNTNHPKSKQADKSGSGIGLEQVARRLELMYAGHYTWQRGPSPDGSLYSSTIAIDVECNL